MLFVIKHFTKYTLCCRTHLTTLSHLLAVGGVTHSVYWLLLLARNRSSNLLFKPFSVLAADMTSLGRPTEYYSTTRPPPGPPSSARQQYCECTACSAITLLHCRAETVIARHAAQSDCLQHLKSTRHIVS